MKEQRFAFSEENWIIATRISNSLPTTLFDPRLIGEDSPIPQLEALAFGNYVFSHEWQIEWFTKIGKENGNGGLEELYLDDFPIFLRGPPIWPIRCREPWVPRSIS